MILEDITDIECSICTDSESYHSSEAYFIFTETLMMERALAGGKGGAQWGKEKTQSSLKALHLKGRNVFLCLLIIFPLG